MEKDFERMIELWKKVYRNTSDGIVEDGTNYESIYM